MKVPIKFDLTREDREAISKVAGIKEIAPPHICEEFIHKAVQEWLNTAKISPEDAEILFPEE